MCVGWRTRICRISSRKFLSSFTTLKKNLYEVWILCISPRCVSNGLHGRYWAASIWSNGNWMGRIFGTHQSLFPRRSWSSCEFNAQSEAFPGEWRVYRAQKTRFASCLFFLPPLYHENQKLNASSSYLQLFRRPTMNLFSWILWRASTSNWPQPILSSSLIIHLPSTVSSLHVVVVAVVFCFCIWYAFDAVHHSCVTVTTQQLIDQEQKQIQKLAAAQATVQKSIDTLMRRLCRIDQEIRDLKGSGATMPSTPTAAAAPCDPPTPMSV